MASAWTVAGFLVLALLVVDVFTTAFDARGTGGPVVRRLNRTVWSCLRPLHHRVPRLGSRILESGGPLMAIGTIVTWAALLVLGFTLVYLPHVLDFHFEAGAPGGRLLEAFYYSGILASTVGLGDVVPLEGWTRVLTVVEGLGGFALLTVSTSYILAVYREQLRTQTVAALIDVHLRDPSKVPDEAGSGGPEAVAAWERDVTPGLLRVMEAHFHYPVLHYFRPSDPRHALPVQVARLHRFHEAVRREAANGSEFARTLTAHPAHVGLRSALEKYLEEIHRHFVRTDGDEETPGDEDDDPTSRRLHELLRNLEWEERHLDG